MTERESKAATTTTTADDATTTTIVDDATTTENELLMTTINTDTTEFAGKKRFYFPVRLNGIWILLQSFKDKI